MKLFGYFCVGVIMLVILWISGAALGWFGRAADVVQQEVDPFALQHKYEWFKDAAAQLDARHADIAVYESRFKAIGGKVGECPASADRTAREQCMVWVQEVSGIIASYNALAADYNSQMSKWNYSFTNVGQLPKGAAEPLPREFKPYAYN
jgi:hypothetical protein